MSTAPYREESSHELINRRFHIDTFKPKSFSIRIDNREAMRKENGKYFNNYSAAGCFSLIHKALDRNRFTKWNTIKLFRPFSTRGTARRRKAERWS